MGRKNALEIYMNDMTYQTIYARIRNLALNVFKWNGLPENIQPEYIERVLFGFGSALFFKDTVYGFMCLHGATNGELNVYKEPVKFRAIGHGGYNKEYDVDNAVYMRNNPHGEPTQNIAELYAIKLTAIERTLDTNLNAQKTPFILVCNDKELLSLKNIYRQIETNVPAIFVDKGFSLDAIKMIETNAPFLLDKLADYKHDVWNDLMSVLGINNANTDKRERLITDEVNANNDSIDQNIDFMLEERKKGCDKINKMFGLSMSVELKHKPEEPAPEETNNGGEDNGEV